MNNLHRELAPISDAAWAQIEMETSRTLKRYFGGRRVVDMLGPGGTALSAIGTGHLQTIDAPAQGVVARQRQAAMLVELRAPFELDRQMIDDVERGAGDADWQPAKDAARQIAFAEECEALWNLVHRQAVRDDQRRSAKDSQCAERYDEGRDLEARNQ